MIQRYTNIQYFQPINNPALVINADVSCYFLSLRMSGENCASQKKQEKLYLLCRARETRFIKGSLKESTAEHSSWKSGD